MSTLEQIESAITNLSPMELARFRQWFAECDSDLWDQQIEEDAKAGRLDALAQEALEEYRNGQCREL